MDPKHQSADDSKVIAEDIRNLHSMGYAQELARRMHGFSNFAISFSIICILSGGINSLGQGISGVGGAAIGIGWPPRYLVPMVFAPRMARGPRAHLPAAIGGHQSEGQRKQAGMLGQVIRALTIAVGSLLRIEKKLLECGMGLRRHRLVFNGFLFLAQHLCHFRHHLQRAYMKGVDHGVDGFEHVSVPFTLRPVHDVVLFDLLFIADKQAVRPRPV